MGQSADLGKGHRKLVGRLGEHLTEQTRVLWAKWPRCREQDQRPGRAGLAKPSVKAEDTFQAVRWQSLLQPLLSQQHDTSHSGADERGHTPTQPSLQARALVGLGLWPRVCPVPARAKSYLESLKTKPVEMDTQS